MCAITFILAGFLLVPLGCASAQQQLPVRHARHVRITAPECGMHSRIGVLEGFMGDTLMLAFGTSTIRCARTSVTRLQQRYGWESHIAEGITLGLLLGVTVGAVYVSATYEECVPRGIDGHILDCNESKGDAYALGGVTGGFLGTVIGAAIGSVIKTDGWLDIPLDQLRMSLILQRQEFALGLSVSY